MVINLNRGLFIWAAILLLLGLCFSVAAHNGAVAIAVPVEGIKVDGDLSDWPAGMRRYPIALPEYGERPKDAADFQGDFRIGYNQQENALYVAVEIQDESVVIDTVAGATWNTQDGCEVYVEVGHEEKDPPAIQCVIWGTKRGVYGPGVAETDMEVEVQREGGIHRYEWRINIGKVSRGKVHLHPEMILGIAVVVSDKDHDGSFSQMVWNNTVGRGDVILAGKDLRTGKVGGRVRWQETGEGIAHAKVRIQSLAAESSWVQVGTDGEGAYTTEMPEGRYTVAVAEPGREKEEERVTTVEVGQLVKVALAVEFPRGLAVQAGPGRTAKAGPGLRQGAWLNFDVPEGLPYVNISAISQDREGDLWLGTRGGGVSRYDGQQFKTFTVEDGLANNRVQCIMEDQKGSLWLGTQGGICRYDGRQWRSGPAALADLRFTTFTTADGLLSNDVWSMAEDREGYLWFGTQGGGVSRYDGQKFKTFTTREGLASNDVWAIVEDRNGHLWFATHGGVCRYDGRQFTTFTAADGLASNDVHSAFQDRGGYLWFGTDGGGVSSYDGQRFTTFTVAEGLASNSVMSIAEDREGYLWFGTMDRGVSQYDGRNFKTFTTEDGLVNNLVNAVMEDQRGSLWFGTFDGISRYDGEQLITFTAKDGLGQYRVVSILEDREGYLWLGTWGGGVSRYDGKNFKTFTTADGLAGNNVTSIVEDREGYLWLGTWEGGVSRYDGKTFKAFTTADGLGNNRVEVIAEDREGYLWFGTVDGGVSRYDGKAFKTFTTADGLANNWVVSIIEDRERRMWFGTVDGGVSRYDGKTFKTFTTADGLTSNGVWAIVEDQEGLMWFGTGGWAEGGGVSWYDGKTFKTFTAADGLANIWVRAIAEDREGHLWFGTYGGGVSRYDGMVFQHLLRQDGLASNVVWALLIARNGDVWIGTQGGVTRYRSRSAPPPIHLITIVADREYGPVEEIRLPSSQQYLAFEFQGRSFKTRPGQMIYRYRLAGYDKDWRQTRESRVEYTDLPRGDYVFQVKAVDRDLAYSEEPAEVRVVIHLPYGQIALMGGLGLALGGLGMASGYGIKRRRDFQRSQQERDQAREALVRELEKELQTAHEMQMALMPKEPPRIAGFEITGRCMPANHVGGDLFQYFQRDSKLSVCLADVTGHAMAAAIPVVMFSGILKSQMEIGGTVEELFRRLNRSLHGTLTGHTLVCLAMGELDPSTRRFRFSNAGCPYPYHYRAATGEVVELQMDAHPLGMRPDTTYRGAEVQLEPGDRVVFCSDGIAEAANAVGELFGFERTAETVRRGCAEDLSAEALLARIIQEVKGFRGETPQGDDQTVVVLEVDDRRSA